MVTSIFDGLSRVIPDQQIRVDEEHTFTVHSYDNGTRHAVTDYVLSKAPITYVRQVEGTVDGRDYVFTKGTDYTVVDDDGDGQIDTIDFSVGGEQPDDNTTFTVYYVAEPIISRYIEPFDSDGDDIEADIAELIESHQVDTASGSDLDEIGRLFGPLGRRRGRTDAEFRVFLRSIVPSFSGRGTLPGMRFAISAAIGTDPSDITIVEDFDEVGYEIRIDNVDANFLVGTVNDIAELTDPSGVELLSSPVIVLGDTGVAIAIDEATVVGSSTGLGSQTLTLDGSSQTG
jgi:hypothetical protein